jgi:hypothetical protein
MRHASPGRDGEKTESSALSAISAVNYHRFFLSDFGNENLDARGDLCA